MLLDTLAWILEKLGVLPDEAERARKKIEDAQRAYSFQDKVALLQGTWQNQSAEACGKWQWHRRVITPKTINRSEQQYRYAAQTQQIADNTGKAVEGDEKRIGPDDIVFKTCPEHLLIREEWQGAEGCAGQ